MIQSEACFLGPSLKSPHQSRRVLSDTFLLRCPSVPQGVCSPSNEARAAPRCWRGPLAGARGARTGKCWVLILQVCPGSERGSGTCLRLQSKEPLCLGHCSLTTQGQQNNLATFPISTKVYEPPSPPKTSRGRYDHLHLTGKETDGEFTPWKYEAIPWRARLGRGQHTSLWTMSTWSLPAEPCELGPLQSSGDTHTVLGGFSVCHQGPFMHSPRRWPSLEILPTVPTTSTSSLPPTPCDGKQQLCAHLPSHQGGTWAPVPHVSWPNDLRKRSAVTTGMRCPTWSPRPLCGCPSVSFTSPQFVVSSETRALQRPGRKQCHHAYCLRPGFSAGSQGQGLGLVCL